MFLRSIALITTLAMNSNSSVADELYGSIECNIKSLQTTEMLNGTATTYDRFGGDKKYDVGDTLNITFSELRDLNYVQNVVEVNNVEIDSNLFDPKSQMSPKRIWMKDALLGIHILFYSNDEIHIGFPTSNLSLTKYGESMWNGYLLRNDLNNLFAEIFGLDCLIIKDAFPNLLNLYFK